MGRAFLGMVVAVLVGGSAVARAETGMGLMVDTLAKKLRRVDLKDNVVIFTSGPIGTNILNGRFSPDGSKMVTIDEAKQVAVRDLYGNVIKAFTAFEAGRVSWTNSGIWVGGTGKVVRYNATTGALELTITLKAGGSGATAVTAAEAALTKVQTVSLNDKTAGGRPDWAASVLLDQKDSSNRAPVIKLGSGCSVGPSPDGSRLTRNLWETGVEHQTMKIHDRTGAEVQYLTLFETIRPNGNRLPGDVWSWNSQLWSSNSPNIILIPTGRGFPQMTETTIPFIYDLVTKKSYSLYPNWTVSSGVSWYIKDYYTGKTGPLDQCNSPADCNDNDICTTNTCTAGKCSNPAIANCCTSASQCNDSKICTNDVCSANQCSNPAIANCCTSASQCNDGVVCTSDLCSGNQCSNPPISNCCTDNSDCVDIDLCTNDTCNTITGECSNISVVGCCTDASQCDDGKPCTDDKCVANVCDNPPTPNCCVDASQCDDGNICTTDTCDSLRCNNPEVLDCCIDAADCNDEDDCTTDTCSDNNCDNPPILDCNPDPVITLMSPTGGEVFSSGTTTHIRWTAVNVHEVVVYLSVDGGEAWPIIGRVNATDSGWTDLPWEIEASMVSDECMIRIEGYSRESPVQSDVFVITDLPPGELAPLMGGCTSVRPDAPLAGLLLGMMLAFRLAQKRRRRSGQAS